MRVAILVAVLGGSAVANAETFKPPIVWQNRVVDDVPRTDGAIALTNVSRVLYLNDCRPNGCTVSPGTDNSITNRSSIPQSTVTLNPYGHGQQHWNQLVQCVKDTFAPFTIEVVTTDPGQAPHFEVMIGGSDNQLHPQLQAGGVAPYVSCNAQRSNGLSFVFPETTSNLNYLCGAVVQEAVHVWGLDHELNAKDPMTYLELGSLKRFQNDDADCGEDTPRNCRCAGQSGVPGNSRKQNSYRYMINTFGLKPGLAEPTITVVAPTEGEWVKPGFPIVATMMSPLDPLRAELKVDNGAAVMFPKTPFTMTAPTNITGGPHALTITALDMGERTATATVNVNVMSSCANGESCISGTHCIRGLCVPGSEVEGGLGSACESHADCLTDTCASTGDSMTCTGFCDATTTCPSGYACTENTAGQFVCAPDQSSGGGCSTTGSPAWLLGVLGFLMLALRRRR